MPNHELIAELEDEAMAIPKVGINYPTMAKSMNMIADLFSRAAAALREVGEREQDWENKVRGFEHELNRRAERIEERENQLQNVISMKEEWIKDKDKTIAELQANNGELALQNAKLLTDVDQLLSDRNELQAELEQAKAEINLLHAQCRSAYDALYEEECARVNAERKALKGGEDE